MTDRGSSGIQTFALRRPYCGGCGGGSVSLNCCGSLQRRGIQKVHWECWSECNLACPFCFRTNGRPLGTEGALLLLRALSTGAARTVVLAGGDPSLRRDLPEIIAEALGLGLSVQVQTNGQYVTQSFLRTLGRCEYVGLSVDGGDAATHDGFRRKPGNFKQVTRLFGELEKVGVPVSVRTVVTYENHRTVPEIAQLILSYSNVICWKLLEFTAVGDGFVNRNRYSLRPALFERTVSAAREQLGDSAHLLEVLRNVDKVGIYMMISAQGLVYGITDSAVNETGQHDYIGSMLSDHLDHLAERLPFSGQRRPERRTRADIESRTTTLPSVG